MKIEAIDEDIIAGKGIPPLNNDDGKKQDASTNTYGTTKIKGRAYSYVSFKRNISAKSKKVNGIKIFGKKGKRSR